MLYCMITTKLNIQIECIGVGSIQKTLKEINTWGRSNAQGFSAVAIYLAMVGILYAVIRFHLPGIAYIEGALFIFTGVVPIACGIYAYNISSKLGGVLRPIFGLVTWICSTAILFYITMFVMLNLGGS